MPDKQRLTPDQAKSFVSEMQKDGYSDDEITAYLTDHADVAPPGFWEQHPTAANLTRSGLRVLPAVGAIAGGIAGTAAEPGLGTGTGVMLGAAGGESLANFGEEALGLRPPQGLMSGMRSATNAASVAGATEGLGNPQTAGKILKTGGRYIEDLGARAGKRGIDILPGGKMVSLMMSDAAQKGGQMMRNLGLRLAPEITIPRVPLPTSPIEASPLSSETGLMRRPPIVTPPPSDVLPNDPSFIRSVPGSAAQSERLALPEGREAITPSAPADTSGATVTRAAKTELPVRDPKTGRMRRVYTSESVGTSQTPRTSTQGAESASAPSPVPRDQAFRNEVQKLSDEGLGAQDIADQLKNHPALKGASPRERINLVREARGGQSGQVPARAKKAIDAAIEKLGSDAEKRAYLLKAPNGAVYDYIRTKLGL